MKKSQRLRFYSLVAKQAKGEALTIDESADLKTLSALVATHPNAAEDTDDETDEEKKKRLEKEKEDEAAKKKAEDEKKEEDEKKKKDEEAKGAKPGVSARLSAALKGLTGGTPAQAAADLKTEQTAHAKTKADLSAKDQQIATLNAQLKADQSALSALCDFLGIKPAEISGKTQSDVDGILTAKIQAASIEQVASLGFPSVKLPAPAEGAGTAATKAELHKEFAAITDSTARAEFYAKHKDKLLG